MKKLLLLFRWLLFPIACVYAIITTLRNWLYSKGIFRSHSFPVPTIVVGNLTVGGTGKTPHTEYLIRLLKDTHTLIILSRGYGRKTKGFLIADDNTKPQQIGDEPMQFFRKFGKEITVTVGEDRVAAIGKIYRRIKQTVRNTQHTALNSPLILLDDAFQHRPVKPSLSILLTDYNRLFYNDLLLPTGNLRETRIGARRADVVIVSKCPPDLPDSARQQISSKIRKYTKLTTPVFFSSIRYSAPLPFSEFSRNIFSNQLILVSGIAQSHILEEYIKQNFDCKAHLDFKDHHNYTQADITTIQAACQKAGVSTVLTTEKDFVKLSQLELPPEISFFYLPIEIYFLFEEKESFNQLIVN
ncbi:tetraacyldisaccharide 4'-kinase [Xanthocytophaga flava]|uniref:tetraacyldisaccharide 4'-kinase n=1 Tax=Xanthocytophaga flava TaxID=3048013 RepID=UPI0028D081D9|nr:tetraacyldisaccharide 4'-kinase [Xanthocytophaga flavus]MDJ1468327.1 tetraacyldisaccharide 4'-kinase [Xanthocytophaga flavus]